MKFDIEIKDESHIDDENKKYLDEAGAIEEEYRKKCIVAFY